MGGHSSPPLTCKSDFLSLESLHGSANDVSPRLAFASRYTPRKKVDKREERAAREEEEEEEEEKKEEEERDREEKGGWRSLEGAHPSSTRGRGRWSEV